jgi:membrane protease YdiL (CAAX protease family)
VAAIVLSAILFGVGHLPALAATYPLTGPLVLRTVALNALVGIGLGWLFWRHSLETGMMAHASFHVALLVTSTAVVLLT